MAKFNDEKFIEGFVKKLKAAFDEKEIAFKTWGLLDLSTHAKEVCRALRYAMLANRDKMNELVESWWDGLPEHPEFGKVLFDMRVVPTHTMGASFIKIVKGFNARWGMLRFDKG